MTATQDVDARASVIDAIRDRSLQSVNAMLGLSVVAVASVASLRHVAEPFAAASDIGDVVFDLSIAYLAGWIFYYLTSWRPERQRKARVLPVAARSAIQLAAAVNGFLNHVSDASQGAVAKGTVKRAALAQSMATLRASTLIQMISYDGAQLDLAAGAEYATRRVDERVGHIERWGTFLEPEFLRLVYAVADSPFLRYSRDGSLATLRSTESVFGAGGATALIAWCEASDQLRTWVCDHMREELTAAGYDTASIRDTRILDRTADESR